MANDDESNEEHLAKLRIPEDRIGALIGEDGKSKRRLEEVGDCSLDIDSETGQVTVTSDESVDVYFVKEVVDAVGHGFNPSTASLILKKDYLFEIIDVKNYAPSDEVDQLKGRVIGTNGKTRETIEDLTEAYLSVYDSTVSIIGRIEHIEAARRAVQKLLNGQSHSAVYQALEAHRDKVNRRRLANTGTF